MRMPWWFNRLRTSAADKQGAALIMSLLFVGILALLGAAAVTSTSIDALIGGHYKASVRAFQAAEAGLEEARGRLMGEPAAATYTGDPSATPDPDWSSYILTNPGWQFADDPSHNANFTNYIPTASSHTNTTVTANTLQPYPPAISYWVKIRHKREYDAEQAGHNPSSSPPALHYGDYDGSTTPHTDSARGNIIYYGYGNPAAPTTALQFTTGSVTTFKPVHIIRAYGRSGSGVKIVEIEAVHPPGPPKVAALYAKTAVTINGGGGGNQAEADGRDYCNPNFPVPHPSYPDLIPVYTVHNPTTDNGNVSYDGTPPSPVQGGIDIDIAELISTLKSGTTTIVDKFASNITNWGNASDFGGWYANANTFVPPQLRLDNVTGYGLLLIDGDLELSGHINWHGLILVNGDITFNGAGPSSDINVFGAILAENAATLNGNPDVAYHSCNIAKSLTNLPLIIMSWKEIF